MPINAAANEFASYATITVNEQGNLLTTVAVTLETARLQSQLIILSHQEHMSGRLSNNLLNERLLE